VSNITIEMTAIDISVTCSVCGADLNVKLNRNQDEAEIEPCSGCMSDSYNDGYDTAKKEAANG
jgi:hypothetical protein